MNDSISRQKTIEEVDKYFDGLPIQGHYDIVQIIKNMPSVEPKRIRWEEPEINPCLGCDDYDGRGGCKSHGGCGAERSEDE